MASTRKLLQKGIELFHAGDIASAKVILAQTIRLDPSLPDAWWYLAQCVADPQQQEYCIKRVLQLNPHHAGALAMQQKDRPKARPIDTPGPVSIQEPQTALSNQVSTNEPPSASRDVPRKKSVFAERKTLWIVGAALSILLLLGVLWLGPKIFASLRNTFFGPGSQPVGESMVTPAVFLPTTAPTRPAATPTPTSSTPIPTLSPRKASDTPGNAELQQALYLMSNEKYDQAMVYLDRAIELDPEYAEAYYHRARNRYQISLTESNYEEFLDEILNAIADLDQAISIAPTKSGDYYLLRADVYSRLSSAMPFRVDRQYLDSIALENLRIGIALYNTRPYSERAEPLYLTGLGQCDEAQLLADELVEARGRDAAPSGYLSLVQAGVYLCRGDYHNALAHYGYVHEFIDSIYHHYARAFMYYMLGQNSNALNSLDESITAVPNKSGYRYFLRALIYYDQGDSQQAIEDIQRGAVNTWGLGGIAYYVMSKIALDEGNVDDGVHYLQLAEATFKLDTESALITRVRDELSALGEQPIEIPISMAYLGTPIPPLDPDLPPESRPPKKIRIWMDEGTGPVEIEAGERLDVHVVPRASFQADAIERLVIFLEGEASDQTLDLEILLPWTNGIDPWDGFKANWGENPVSDPEKFVPRAGDVYLRLSNNSETSLHLADIGISLTVLTRSGTLKTYSMPPPSSP